ncbi:Uncharacterized protein Fot_24418 [Forsythia ovata]|uniref:Uncharacterized protein n=1 Tax=Forsythia ovata TaxID=205694 RepID=A0ABD1U671_9LAMI
MLGPSSSSKVAVRESTVVESNETPMVGSKSRFSYAEVKSTAQDFCGNILKGTVAVVTSTAARESEISMFELTLSSSLDYTGTSDRASPKPLLLHQKPRLRRSSCFPSKIYFCTNLPLNCITNRVEKVR